MKVNVHISLKERNDKTYWCLTSTYDECNYLYPTDEYNSLSAETAYKKDHESYPYASMGYKFIKEF